MIQEFKDVKWLYAISWYDGVQIGVCLIEGKKYYAYWTDSEYDEEGIESKRKYIVLDLNKDDWDYEIQRNEDYKELVGNHWEFDPETQVRNRSKLKDPCKLSEYREKYPHEKRQEEVKRYQTNYKPIGEFWN